MTQCLGLSLLSSIVATLGVGPVSRGGSGGGAGSVIAGVVGSSDEKHIKELQGSQASSKGVALVEEVGKDRARLVRS